MNLFDGPDLLETTSTEVKNRILKPGQMLRAIDTGALYYGDKDGKPTAFVGASTTSDGVVAIEAEGVVSEWQSAVMQEGADGGTYILYGVRADGSFFGRGVDAQTDMLHIPLHGQSNMMGDDALPPLSTGNTGWGNMRFARGVATWTALDNPTAPELRADSGFSLVPLTAGSVENRANGFADALKARLVGASRYSPAVHVGPPHVLISSAAIGGRKITELGPENHGVGDHPGGHWTTLIDDIKRGKKAASAAGCTYKLPFWVYDQGESEADLKLYYQGTTDTIENVRAGYKTRALAMVQAFDVQARTLAGQARPVPVLVTPAQSTSITSSAWLELSNETDLVKLVGPRYMTLSALNSPSGTGGSQTWGDKIHHTPDSHRWIGEMCAKVAHRIFVEGENWQPLKAVKAVKVDATRIDVTFNVPRPPLVVDVESIVKVRGWGVSVFAGTLTAPTGRTYPTALEVLPDGRTVRLTFASIPAGAMLDFGQSVADIGSSPAVAAVGSAANNANGFAQHTISIAGDIRAALAPLSQEGAFYVRATNRVTECVVRSVAYDGTNTVLTGETREIRTDGSYVSVQAGDTLSFGRIFSATNVRDSDNAASLYTFSTGPNAGKPYPLYNWCCRYDSLPVTGA